MLSGLMSRCMMPCDARNARTWSISVPTLSFSAPVSVCLSIASPNEQLARGIIMQSESSSVVTSTSRIILGCEPLRRRSIESSRSTPPSIPPFACAVHSSSDPVSDPCSH
eukprot:scaffold75646_cov40-Tisochrysis_lutea.AAC.1